MSTPATNRRGALWAAVDRSEKAHALLAFKLAPLLALCEFAARAEHSLRAVGALADMHEPTRKRLDGMEPEWRAPMGGDGIAQEIGQCMALARELCTAAAEEAQALTREAAAAHNEEGPA